MDVYVFSATVIANTAPVWSGLECCFKEGTQSRRATPFLNQVMTQVRSSKSENSMPLTCCYCFALTQNVIGFLIEHTKYQNAM